MKPDAENESDVSRATSEPPCPKVMDGGSNGWSFCGFEFFDLIVVVVQSILYFASLSLDPLFVNPVFRFAIGIGFFVTIFFLSRTQSYARGVKKIQSEHEYLGAIVFIGGAVLGIIVLALFVFGPIKQMLDHFQMESSWLGHVGVPFSIVALGYLPYLSICAERKSLEDKSQFQNFPIVWMYAGRAILLILANLILFTMFHDFVESNQVKNVLTAIFFMLLFYIPVRMQEMFLHPHGPHFQSLFQTLFLMALGNSSVLFFQR